MEQIRLQKYLADSGIASRRKAEEYIINGEVTVNDKIAELGMKVFPEKDVIKFKGKIVKNNKKDFIYILLNKPIGYVTTVKDQFDRPTVLDLVKVNRRIVPVRKVRYVYIWGNHINR